MIFNIAICDDNIDHLINSEFIIEDIFDYKNHITYIETFLSSKKLKEMFIKQPKHYDFIFLDIEMPDISGLELGKIIRNYNKDVILIYLTSHTKYSIEAFDNNPFNYLVKPIDKYKLSNIIDQALEYKKEQLKKNINKSQKIDIKINKSTIVIETDIIQYVKKQKNTCTLFTTFNNHKAYITLKELEAKLHEKNILDFIRCHQSYIVNSKYIWKHENSQFILTDKTLIPISRKYSKSSRDKFINLLRSNY